MVLQNPLPLQGLVATTPIPPPAPAAPTADSPIGIGTHHLLALTTDEVNLQTRHNQYGSTAETTDPSVTSTSKATNIPLHLPPFPPHPPIWRVANNATARAAMSYSIVDDLPQTPTTMSALEVLKTCPMQRKSLLASLGAVDPFDSKLISFDLDKGEPRIPSTIAFQI